MLLDEVHRPRIMNVMGVKNGSVTQHDQMTPRQEVIAEMRKRGETMETIARELGCSTATVWKDLQRVREIWKARSTLHYDELVAEATQRFEMYLSKLAPRIERGDPRAIEVALKGEDRFARLVGMDKPVETKVTISIEAVAARIAELKAKAGDELPVIEGEIVEETA